MSIGGFFAGLGGALALNLVMLLFGWFGFPLDAGGALGSGYPFLVLGIDGVLAIVIGLVIGRLVHLTERDNNATVQED